METRVKTASNNIPVVIGIQTRTDDGSAKPISFSLIEKEIQSINTEGYAGISFFFYGSLWNSKSLPPGETEPGRKGNLTTVLKHFQDTR
jgi:hypothetical protein